MTSKVRASVRATCVGLSLALISVTPRVARAQEAPSDEAAVEQRRTEAKSKYQTGVEAYERKRYKDAVDLFLAADRLAPSAPLSFNIARAYERLGDDSSALRWYRDYLRRNPTAPNGDDVRQTVAKLASALEKKGVQQLSISSTPPGATVSVDEQPVGVTPWTGDLPPGKHHVLLSARGYADNERELELGSSEPLDLNVHLDPASSGVSAPAFAEAAPQAPPPPPAATMPPTAPPSHKGMGVWPWVTIGTGAAVLGGSLTFELLRRSAESDAEKERTQLGFQSALDKVDSRKTTARVLLGVGGALVVTGGVLLVLDTTSRQSGVQAAFACVPDGCALAAGSRF
ncbi:MAG TPA: PEGA domain-containing protein [Polyangiaceae bacterium]|nr:PEGA domain-containing protein [Polyangiaceae bacterium]